MPEETDVVQQLFENARARIRDDGFSEKVVSRLAWRHRVRSWVVIGAALFGILLFSSNLLGVEFLIERVLAVSQIEFEALSVANFLGSDPLYVLVIFLVSVGVVSSTTISLIQYLGEGRR